MKNWSKNLIAILLCLCVLGQNVQGTARAEGITWKKAYTQFLSNKNTEVYGNKIKNYNGNIKFEIKDLNADGIPELVFDTSSYYGDSCSALLYIYQNGKVKYVGEAGHAGSFYCFKKSKIFKVEAYKWGTVYYDYHYYYKLSKGKMKLIASRTVDLGTDGTQNKSYYEINGKKCTKTKFNAFLKKNQCNGKKYRVGSKYSISKGNIKKAIKEALN